MGEARFGPGAEERVRTLSGATAKPAAERLYGRIRGNQLRPRQITLLDVTLPRLRLDERAIADPLGGFATRPQAVWLEVGFGSGEHAIALLAGNPGIGLIACEVYENGICALLSALVPEGGEATAPLPGNLRLWPDDARALLRRLPPGCLDGLVLMFPDPWPKARHAKRRFVHPDNVALVAQALRPGGEWRIASDDPTYQAWCGAVLAAQTLFDVPPPSAARPEGWPPTRYERKAALAGRPALFWCATRIAP